MRKIVLIAALGLTAAASADIAPPPDQRVDPNQPSPQRWGAYPEPSPPPPMPAYDADAERRRQWGPLSANPSAETTLDAAPPSPDFAPTSGDGVSSGALSIGAALLALLAGVIVVARTLRKPRA